MKIIHIGDIHLKSGPHLDDKIHALKKISAIVEKGTGKHNDAESLVLIPGDVFEGLTDTTPEERNVFASFIREMEFLKTRVIIIRGNHDPIGHLEIFRLSKNVTVISDSPEWVTIRSVDHDVHIFGVPWPTKSLLARSGILGEGGLSVASEMLGTLIRDEVSERRANHSGIFIVAGHLSVTGALIGDGQPLIGREISVSLEDLIDSNADFVALNHIHKYQEMADRIVYPGSLTGNSFGESDEKKFVIIYTKKDGSIEWESVDSLARPWRTIDATLIDGEIVEDDIDFDPVDSNLRYRYRCHEKDAHLFNHSEIEERFSSAHYLKIEPVIERSSNIRSEDICQAHTIMEKFEAWCKVNDITITDSLREKVQGFSEKEEGDAN